MPYPWYELVRGVELQQGDILRECPVVLSGEYDPEIKKKLDAGEKPEYEAEIAFADVIVMSQSCDLAAMKIENVALCEVIKASDSNSNVRKLKDIRKGAYAQYHLINKSEEPHFELAIVHFASLFSMPLQIITAHANASGDRPRLLPPYREHLAQAFARFYMRVGLPDDIPDEAISEIVAN